MLTRAVSTTEDDGISATLHFEHVIDTSEAYTMPPRPRRRHAADDGRPRCRRSYRHRHLRTSFKVAQLYVYIEEGAGASIRRARYHARIVKPMPIFR